MANIYSNPQAGSHIQETIVPVIATFDTEGYVLPLYIRINGESFRVTSSNMIQQDFAISRFKCFINDAGRFKSLNLSYHPDRGIWTIDKQRFM